MNKGNKYSNIKIIVPIAVILWLMFFVNVIHYIVKNQNADTVRVDQDNPYTINYHGKTIELNLASDLIMEPLKKGEEISFSTILKGEDIRDPQIYIEVSSVILTAYFDGKEIYKSDVEGKSLYGYGYLMIELPSDFAGHEITIKLKAMEDGEVRHLHNLLVCNGLGMYRYNMGIHFHDILTVLILLIMGVLVWFVAMVRREGNKPEHSLLYLSLYFVFVAIWISCNRGITLLINPSLTFRAKLEYPAFYLAPLMYFLGLKNEFYSEEKNKKIRVTYQVLLWADIIYNLAALILNITDIMHYPRVLMVNHLLILLMAIFIIFMCIRCMKTKEDKHILRMVGIIVFMLCAVFDLADFAAIRYLHVAPVDMSFASKGILFFSLSILADFLLNYQKNLYATAEKETFKKMAGTDMLTEMANRRQCEEVFEALENLDTKYCIISFDINNLKVTNDNYGHLEGDRLLKDFAELVRSVFSQYGLVGRMGGDEFVVIIKDLDRLKDKGLELNELLKKIENKRKEINKDRKPYPISFAYGVAFSYEIDENAEGLKGAQAVSSLSDARMYEMKNRMKKKNPEIKRR